jgi:hypothetical protein
MLGDELRQKTKWKILGDEHIPKIKICYACFLRPKFI